MKKKYFILLSAFFFLLIFNQCKKEAKCLGKLTFTEAELKIIPYTGNETLVFKDSIGDSLIFKINDRGSYTYPYFKNPDSYEQTDYYEYEYNYISFINNDKIDLRFSNPFISNKTIKYFDINFNSFTGTYEFDANNIAPSVFHDTLTIINKTFNSVYELKTLYLNLSGNSLLFYTFNEGIVGFENNGKYWYLE